MANAPYTAGLTPAKLSLIIVLSVILLVMVVVQFGGRWAEDSTRRNQSIEDPAVAALVGEATISGDLPADDAAPESAWPAFPISQVLVHNPFALPEALRPAEIPIEEAGEDESPSAVAADPRQIEMHDRRAEFLASLQEQGVDMILMTPKGRVARVGELTLRVGDVIEGLLVRDISSDGVVFVTHPATSQR